jgi:hypothetical protein
MALDRVNKYRILCAEEEDQTQDGTPPPANPGDQVDFATYRQRCQEKQNVKAIIHGLFGDLQI